MAEQKEWKNLVLCVVVGFFLSPALFLELLYKNKQTNKQTNKNGTVCLQIFRDVKQNKGLSCLATVVEILLSIANYNPDTMFF